MDINEAIHRRRSVRQFRQEAPNLEQISSIIDTCRFAHSVGNMQALRYTIATKPSLVAEVHQHTCLSHIHQPGEQSENPPPVYIACCAPRGSSPILYADAGSAFQNMGLTAYSLGIHLFWIHAFSSSQIETLLQVPADQYCLALFALGFPAENPVAVNAPSGGHLERSLGETRTLQVPKLPLKSITTWIS